MATTTTAKRRVNGGDKKTSHRHKVDAVLGRYAHVATSSNRFASAKKAEIKREARQG